MRPWVPSKDSPLFQRIFLSLVQTGTSPACTEAAPALNNWAHSIKIAAQIIAKLTKCKNRKKTLFWVFYSD